MDSHPNILVLVLDALRSDRLGAYGSEKDLSPHIDSFVENNIVFDRAYTCSNATDPSITSIHSGRYPLSTVYHHGPYVTEEEKERAESVITAPEILSENGWQTIAAGRYMGRWHKKGFDVYPELELEQRLVKFRNRLNVLHPVVQKPLSLAFRSLDKIGLTTSFDNGRSQSSVEEFLEHLDERPFYGFVHLMDTHTPYEIGEEKIESLLEKYDYPRGGLFRPGQGDGHGYEIERPWINERDYEYGIGRLIARYDALVMEADEKFGNLVRGLKERDEWKNTIVFVVSDHGESLTEHEIYHDHHGLYEQSVHVPFICRNPSGGSRRISEFVQLHDIAPTILDLTGLKFPDEVDGHSLKPLITGEGEDWPRDEVFFDEAHTQRRSGMRTDTWKYIEHKGDARLTEISGDSIRCRYCDTVHGGPRELYHLEEDPGETRNLVDEREDVATELAERIEDYHNRIHGVDASEVSLDYSDEKELMERLEELGYR